MPASIGMFLSGASREALTLNFRILSYREYRTGPAGYPPYTSYLIELIGHKALRKIRVELSGTSGSRTEDELRKLLSDGVLKALTDTKIVKVQVR